VWFVVVLGWPIWIEYLQQRKTGRGERKEGGCWLHQPVGPLIVVNETKCAAGKTYQTKCAAGQIF